MSESSRIITCLDMIKNKVEHYSKLKTARADTSIAKNEQRQLFLDKWYRERAKTVNYQKLRKQNHKKNINQRMLDRIINAKSTVPQHKVVHSTSANQLSMANMTRRELSPRNTLTHNNFLNWKKSQIKLWKGNYILRNNIIAIKYSPGQYSQKNLSKNSFYHQKKSKQKQKQLDSESKQAMNSTVKVKSSTDWTMNMDTDLKPLVKPNMKTICEREKVMKRANNLYLKRLKQQQNVAKRVIDNRNRTFVT